MEREEETLNRRRREGNPILVEIKAGRREQSSMTHLYFHTQMLEGANVLDTRTKVSKIDPHLLNILFFYGFPIRVG